MSVSIFTECDFKTSSWAGGITKQMYIYPKSSIYKKRNFYIRISTATVENGKSTFTNLKGYDRFLMILKGEISISHDSKKLRELHAFNYDFFKGESNTISIGKCTDFNIMLKRDFYRGLIVKKVCDFPKDCNTFPGLTFGFILSGQYSIIKNDQVMETLTKGQLFLIHGETDMNIISNKDGTALLIQLNLINVPEALP
ncbi:HutD family protein [Dialister hominis]|uniref:HutD family protein n=1 Tax=Dialister hominis TaxID=2582419 RepID=UPI003AB6A61A